MATGEDASAPPMDDEDHPSQYPMLYALMRADDDDAPVPVAMAAAAATSATSLSPLNQCCPLCQQDVTSAADKPVALLPCGHAFHIMCGRMYLARAEGKECTVDACHRTDDEVGVARMRRVADAAVARGEFKMEDLQDPVLRRDIMVRLRDLLDAAQNSGDASRAASTAVAAAVAADEELRSEEAYRVRWLATRAGREGFTFMQKARLLSPYMKNPMAVKREEVTMGRLLELEEQLRRDARGDDEGGATIQAEAAIDNSADMHERISVRNFAAAGLSLSDIYFGLDLKGWQPLCDAGFTAEYITDRHGPYSLTALADLYSIDYKSLVEIGWTIDDIIEKRHTPQELANIGLSFREMWTEMDMTQEDFMALGFSPNKWHAVLGLDKKYLERPLGIGSAELQLMRWTTAEFVKAFDLHPMEQRVLGLVDVPRVAAPAHPIAARRSASRATKGRRIGTSADARAAAPTAHHPHPRRQKMAVKILTLEKGRRRA